MQMPKGGVLGLGKLNHVAIACPDLMKTVAFYRDVLGAEVSNEVMLAEHGVTTVFVKLANVNLELLHPLGGHSPIQSFLDKNRDGGMHHVCLEVRDIDQAMVAVRAMGIRVLGGKPKIGAHGKSVVFLHPKDCNGVLIELEQE